METLELKLILEAMILSSSEPLSKEKMLLVFEEWERPGREKLNEALSELAKDYQERSIELKELSSGFCFQTKMRYNSWISRMFTEKPAKYSRALLETLAIIAYKQPITRPEIEDLRGVSVAAPIIKTLMERDWISIAAYRDVPGKPAVYVTTKNFLDYFNLKSLDELPSLSFAGEQHE